MMPRAAPPFLLLAVAGCSQPAAPTLVAPAPSVRWQQEEVSPLPEGPGTRVLFIGNSLTASNSLPHMVAAMAEAGGVRILHRGVIAPGNSLADQWDRGRAQAVLGREKWDFVVLQQGPSSLPESQVELKKSAAEWGKLIREKGAKPALYMVWPYRGQKDGFELVSESYRAGATAAEGIVLPAGEAWAEALKADPGLELYHSDKLHPTEAGTYLAALVVTHGLTGVRPEKVPTKLNLADGRVTIPDEVAAKLRRAAEAVIDRKQP